MCMFVLQSRRNVGHYIIYELLFNTKRHKNKIIFTKYFCAAWFSETIDKASYKFNELTSNYNITGWKKPR